MVNDINLDYQRMYDSLSKGKKGYKEQLHGIILGCVALEVSINDLIRIQNEKNGYSVLQKGAKPATTPVSYKLKLLKSSGLVDKALYKILTILFRIRNKFAHKLPLPSKILEKEFEILKNINIDSFVDSLPNDSVKFQLIVSYCFTRLLYLSKKLDPKSVLDLTLVGDIKPIEGV